MTSVLMSKRQFVQLNASNCHMVAAAVMTVTSLLAWMETLTWKMILLTQRHRKPSFACIRALAFLAYMHFVVCCLLALL